MNGYVLFVLGWMLLGVGVLAAALSPLWLPQRNDLRTPPGCSGTTHTEGR